MKILGKTQAEIDAERLAQAAEAARRERNQKLTACDWTQVADAPFDHEAWAAYRKALRDITQQPGWPEKIEWPAEPSSVLEKSPPGGG